MGRALLFNPHGHESWYYLLLFFVFICCYVNVSISIFKLFMKKKNFKWPGWLLGINIIWKNDKCKILAFFSVSNSRDLRSHSKKTLLSTYYLLHNSPNNPSQPPSWIKFCYELILDVGGLRHRDVKKPFNITELVRTEPLFVAQQPGDMLPWLLPT